MPDVHDVFADLGRVFADHIEASIESAFEEGEINQDELLEDATYRWREAAEWLEAVEWFVDEYDGVIEPGRYATVAAGGPQFYASHLIHFLAHGEGYETRWETGTSIDGQVGMFDVVVVVEEADDAD